MRNENYFYEVHIKVKQYLFDYIVIHILFEDSKLHFYKSCLNPHEVLFSYMD